MTPSGRSYCALRPADGRILVLMRGSEDRNALDASIASTVGLVYFGLYLLTLCRTVFWYDSAEYVTAAVTLGIPHPPGYPLYTLIGHLFTLLPIDPAIAVNAMSATFAAIAVAFTYLVWGAFLRASGHRLWVVANCFGRTPWSPKSIAQPSLWSRWFST